MQNTKEKILIIALKLFAKDGYEAVSVRDISKQLGITQSALYKHYKNKKDIFDKIVERMYQIDCENAKEYDVPEEIFENMPKAYQNTSLSKIIAFNIAHFDYLVGDDFGSNLYKLLTLEQYRNAKIADLYQKYFTSGPITYIEDLFREMIVQGILKKTDPKQLALEFYAPLYLLVSVSEGLSDKEEIRNLLIAHFDRFIKQNIVELS